MRIYIRLTKNDQIVPYEHLSVLTGVLNKWISDREIHDSLSLYSFSGLRKGVATKDGLVFPNGGEWFIGAYDSKMLLKIISQIKEYPDIAFGMKVKEVILCEYPVFGSEKKFMLATPILIKRFDGEKSIHFTYCDEDANNMMTDTLKRKMRFIGLDETSVNVRFDKNYNKSKVKLVSYKGIKNRVSLCPVIITGSSECVKFAWDVGIGNSTGIGFGALL
jgi:CRISPR-associated endoribonuclease Cas6